MCWGLLLNKVRAEDLQIYLKRRLQHRCFLVNLAKFLRIPNQQNDCILSLQSFVYHFLGKQLKGFSITPNFMANRQFTCFSKTAVRRSSTKQLFFKIWKSHRKHLCRSFCFNKVAILQAGTLLRKRLLSRERD